MGLHPKHCYKVLGLKDPILDTPNVSYLQDRYALGDELGWGQFGVIRSCSDLVTGELLACKSIAKDRLVSADDLRSVKLEIEVMARLSGHPNVVDLKAVYEEEGFVHLVMELCAGGELFHRIEKCGRFSDSDAGRIFRHLMEVVVYCHENGIVHRDLKPENVLLATRSSSSPIKLADFGLATYIKPEHSWIKGFACQPQSSYGHGSVTNFGCQQNSGSCSFSTLHLSASRDVSFGFASPISCHNQPDPSSPTFTCRTPFSTFYNDATPSPPTIGFSFQNSCESNDMGSSPPVSLMPSFSFFSPPPSDEPEIPLAFRTDSSKAASVKRVSSIVVLCVSLDSGHNIRESEYKEEGNFGRDVVAAASRATISIRSKRNHTIGLGEQLDLMVSETVIRWASCTHLPSAPSLRSSLVC